MVGKGRIQLETGIQWDRKREDALHERTLATPDLSLASGLWFRL